MPSVFTLFIMGKIVDLLTPSPEPAVDPVAQVARDLKRFPNIGRLLWRSKA